MCISAIAVGAATIGTGLISANSQGGPDLPSLVPPPETPDPAEEFALSITPLGRQRGEGLAFGDFFLTGPANRG